MSDSKTEVAYDLTLSVNFTIELNQDTVDAINQAIKDGDIEEGNISEYITNNLINDVENSFDITTWLPEVDGELRAWVSSVEAEDGDATRISA